MKCKLSFGYHLDPVNSHPSKKSIEVLRPLYKKAVEYCVVPHGSAYHTVKKHWELNQNVYWTYDFPASCVPIPEFLENLIAILVIGRCIGKGDKVNVYKG